MNIIPLGDRLLLQKCVHDDIRDGDGKVLIHLTDYTKDDTTFLEVLACGPKCDPHWERGQIVMVASEFHNGLTCIDPEKQLWMARQGVVVPCDWKEAQHG